MKVLILSFCLFASAFSLPKSRDVSGNSRITGGWEVTIEQFPFMVNLEWGWYGSMFDQACGGALLTTVTLLSGGQCFSDDPPEWWRARLGSSASFTGGSIHYVQSIIRHPNLNAATFDGDIAIARLLQPAVYSASVGPARIAGQNYFLADNTPVSLLGWGYLGQYDGAAFFLQEAVAYVVNQEICAENYRQLSTLPEYQGWPLVRDTMICVGDLVEGGKDACGRDVGGPVVHSGDVVVGIISWGNGCGQAMYPGVSTRVSSYSQWVVANGSA